MATIDAKKSVLDAANPMNERHIGALLTITGAGIDNRPAGRRHMHGTLGGLRIIEAPRDPASFVRLIRAPSASEWVRMLNACGPPTETPRWRLGP